MHRRLQSVLLLVEMEGICPCICSCVRRKFGRTHKRGLAAARGSSVASGGWWRPPHATSLPTFGILKDTKALTVQKIKMLSLCLPFPTHLAGELQCQQAAWRRTERHRSHVPAGAPLLPSGSGHPGPRVLQQLLPGLFHQLGPRGTCWVCWWVCASSFTWACPCLPGTCISPLLHTNLVPAE